MKILFDHNVDRRFRRHLPGHDIRTAREERWERLANGELLRMTATRFEAFLSVDKNLEHEQNLSKLPLPVVVINSASNSLPMLIPFAPVLLHLFSTPLESLLYIVSSDESVLRLAAPRTSSR